MLTQRVGGTLTHRIHHDAEFLLSQREDAEVYKRLRLKQAVEQQLFDD